MSTTNDGNESELVEKTINLSEIAAEKIDNETIKSGEQSSKELVESACKILVEEVLKKCPNVNLSSITIKTTTAKHQAPTVTASVNVDSPVTKVNAAAEAAVTSEKRENMPDNGNIITTQVIQLKPTSLHIGEPQLQRNDHRFGEPVSSSAASSISPSAQSSSSSSSSSQIDSVNAIETSVKRIRTLVDEDAPKYTVL